MKDTDAMNHTLRAIAMLLCVIAGFARDMDGKDPAPYVAAMLVILCLGPRSSPTPNGKHPGENNGNT